METDTIDTTETTEQTTAPEQNADTGTQTGEIDKMVQMKQSEMKALFTDARGQAKRNAIGDLLADLGVSDVTALKSIAESHKQADEKRIAEEEAQKTEVEKLDGQLKTSSTLHEQDVATNRELLIKIAIMERAPGKEVDPAHFRDLQTLMDKSGIEVVDGVVDDKTVDAAIDATLEGRDYLKMKAQNGQRPGSPPSKKTVATTVQQQTQQPVVRPRRKTSM